MQLDRRAILRGAAGAAIGAAAGGALWYLTLGVPLSPPPIRDRFAYVAPVLLGCLVVIGLIAGVWGARVTRAIDGVMLPGDMPVESKRLYLLTGLVVALAVVQYHFWSFVFLDPTDLPSFVFAARAMAAGRDFYDPEVIRAFHDQSGEPEVVFPYLYLPLYAVLLRPLALLTLAGGHTVFLVINSLLWPLLFYLCLRLIDVSDRLRPAMAAVVLVVFPSFLPTVQTFHHGSPSLLVAALVVGVLLCAREDRPRLGGALLAFAVLIKVVPILLLPYLLLRRRKRLVLWSLAVMGGLLLLSVAVAGLGPHLHWLTAMAPDLAHGAHTGTFFEPGCHPENQALTGVYCRFLGAESALFRPLSSATGLVVVVVTAAALIRRRGSEVDRVESSLVVVALLMVSTITWFHHMTLMLLPLLTLVTVGSEGHGDGRPSPVVLGVGVAALVTVGFEYYLDPWPFFGPNPITRTFRFDAMLACWVTLLVLAWRRRSAPLHGDVRAGGPAELLRP